MIQLESMRNTMLLTSVSDFEALAELGSCGWHILMFFTLISIQVQYAPSVNAYLYIV
jgi:hypothetical protein